MFLVRNLWQSSATLGWLCKGCVLPWPSLGAGWSSAIPRPCRRVISGGVEVEVLRKGSVLHKYDKSNVLKKRKNTWFELIWYRHVCQYNFGRPFGGLMACISLLCLQSHLACDKCTRDSACVVSTQERWLRRDDKSWTLNTPPYGFQTVIGTTLPFATPAGDEAKPGPQIFEVRFSTSQSIAQIRTVTPSLHSLPRGLLCHHGFQFPSVYHGVQGQNWQWSVTIH